MMFTRDKLKALSELLSEFESAAITHAEKLAKHDSRWNGAENPTLAYDTVYFDWDEHWSYGGFENHREDFSVNDLFDSDAAVERCRVRVEEERAAVERAKADKIRAADLATLAALMKKYPDQV